MRGQKETELLEKTRESGTHTNIPTSFPVLQGQIGPDEVKQEKSCVGRINKSLQRDPFMPFFCEMSAHDTLSL